MSRPINYGSALQTYATQYIIENLGYECQIIDYRYPNDYHEQHGYTGGLNSISLKRRIAKKLGLSPFLRKINKFEKFWYKHLNLTREYINPDDIRASPPIYDVYMTGSDQVWNPRYILGDTVFLMDFVPEGKRIVSYASSFGTNFIEECDKLVYQKYLTRYKNISVREKNGATIVKELLGKEVRICIDPSLLLSPKDWAQIATTKRIVSKQYILVYILKYALNQFSDFQGIIEEIEEIKKQNNMLIVCIGDNTDDIKADMCFNECSPNDFITLFRDASYVVTSSFHGTAFALNYGKPLSMIVNSNSKDDRIISLLDILNVKYNVRTIEDDNIQILSSQYNIDAEQYRLSELRNECIDYMNKIINPSYECE